MSDEPSREARIQEVEEKLERLLQADHLSEEEKIAVLKDALALALAETPRE